jgi:hypothetical protein
MRQPDIIKTPILSGVTPRLRFPILDDDTGEGFKPDALTMTIYDVSYTPLGSSRTTTMPPFGSTPISQSIVNGRDDIDVLSLCDADGNVDLHLHEDDTVVDVPAGMVPSLAYRRILFRWTWDTVKVGKHEVYLTIQPDRETVAT